MPLLCPKTCLRYAFKRLRFLLHRVNRSSTHPLFSLRYHFPDGLDNCVAVPTFGVEMPHRDAKRVVRTPSSTASTMMGLLVIIAWHDHCYYHYPHYSYSCSYRHYVHHEVIYSCTGTHVLSLLLDSCSQSPCDCIAVWAGPVVPSMGRLSINGHCLVGC